ncbi:MAG TPA: nuclear transport factor 2 family protein [Pyrinomonadaceae bacterium]|nr:nuclear transport factor 2 family protein [Pyrinomonadaceae bacterium]
MRRMLLCATLLLAATACTAPGPANTNVTTNANTAATPKAAAVSDSDAIAQEQKVWDAIKNKNFDGFAAFLDEQQVEVTDTGVNNKAATVNDVKKLVVTDMTFADWKVIHANTDAYVITYTATLKGSYDGHDFPLSSARASSAWVSRNGKWMAIYHQQSDVKPPMATPSPTGSPAASPSASPSASTAASASPSPATDPNALENQVWDAIKRRDYTAFSAFLADDFIEVEPDGVYDKAASVKALMSVDLSKFTLSDFQVTRIDDDASLITYVVHPPSPSTDTERHSTIWVKRGGKWLAVFHQGTPQSHAPMVN